MPTEVPTNGQTEGPLIANASPRTPGVAPPESTAERSTSAAWFQKLTIEKRMLAGFSLVFIGVLIITTVSYRNTTILITNSALDSRSHELVQLLDNIDVAMNEAEDNNRRYLVTGDATYLEAYKKVVRQKPMFVTYLKDLTEGSAEQRDRVRLLDQMMEWQLRAESRAIAMLQDSGLKAVKKMALEGAAKRELEVIRQVITEMVTYEQQALRRRVLESAAGTTNTIVLLGIGVLLQFILLASVYYFIRHDITERRRAAAELQRRGELLEAANKELEAFSYSVSHDLRAPLRHIDGYAALLRKSVEQSLNEKAARYLQTISDSARQMGQLIDDLLVFSRMGRQEMLHTIVKVDQLIKEVLRDLQPDLKDRQISWTIGILPEVPGDPAMLRQVFMNLLANAVKFTSAKATATIEIGVHQQTETEVVLYVRDNGVGFDMQYAPKLFGVFQRLHRADEFEGTGIGLANVRRIVHRHGGRTWAEAEPDKGATFFVALPTRRS